VNATYVETVCEWKGESGELLAILTSSLLSGKKGWIDFENGRVVIHGWAEYNQGLINDWRSGRSGGRPKKQEAITPKLYGSQADAAWQPGENKERTPKD